MKFLRFSLPFCLIFVALSHQNPNEDLYKLLGVGRDAPVKEIRKAFKVLAVKLHPDKNKEDADADAKFVKIAKAYEILKDPEKRKKYDLYGDTGEASASGPTQKYHSYTYYRDEFGIYDDDPLIITLSKADYEVNVLDRNQAWFVNFYSPHCHHCHELAPTWRKLAAELEGVIRIAAVNCEDDWSLCYQLSIQAYPTLLYYEREAHLYEGETYTGARTLEALKEFVLSRLPVGVKTIGGAEWGGSAGFKSQSWLLFLCPEGSFACPEAETQLKLAASLEGLLGVGLITDRDLCKEIYANYKNNPIVLWKVDEDAGAPSEVLVVQGADTKEILNSVLGFLPNPVELDEGDFREVRRKLEVGADNPWLLCFYLGAATELSLQLKRLPALLPGFNIGLIKCSRSAALCSALHISHYPTWGIIKLGGAFEIHHGRDVLYEVTAFARDSSAATNLHALSPADFYNLLHEGDAWFVDWYAPWCPPCRKLMPELRRASQHFDGEKVKFGTIDCTLHRNLCAQQGIRSYPTTMLYNGSQIHYFHGVPNEAGIVEFVQDMLNPSIIALNEHNFVQLSRKPTTELWIVDFFAPWCTPCQRLAGEWRNLAKQMAEFDDIKVAHVDCVANADLCSSQNIHGYPTIRLYPLGTKGLSTVAIYNGHRDALSLKRWILSFLPSPVEHLTAQEFRKQILTKKYHLPWLVDFYAPWCGHCTHFEPTFRQVAERLEGKVRTGKVDCEAERDFCRELRVTAYPTVVFYLSPEERHEISSQVPAEIMEQVRKLMERKKQGGFEHDEL